MAIKKFKDLKIGDTVYEVSKYKTNAIITKFKIIDIKEVTYIAIKLGINSKKRCTYSYFDKEKTNNGSKYYDGNPIITTTIDEAKEIAKRFITNRIKAINNEIDSLMSIQRSWKESLDSVKNGIYSIK